MHGPSFSDISSIKNAECRLTSSSSFFQKPRPCVEMVSTQDLNKHRKAGCTRVTTDKKYYEVGTAFIKRTLRKHEWPTTTTDWMPSTCLPQRWTTDAAILTYLQRETDIPLPRLQYTFEDDGAFYFSTELVPGVSMSRLAEEQKQVVTKELLKHIAKLKSLRSDTPGVPGQPLLCAPNRVHSRFWKHHSCWRPRPGMEKGNYVFCHNDLGQHNVIVDPQTLKINAIIDWEYGGFWPEWFERPYWEREGPSAPLGGEEDDRDRCRDWLLAHCDEVEMPRLLSLKDKLDGQQQL
ncbi:hypothetical protein CTA2_9087 [Colletotrichum tanaceti]|uniref:Aminoglycoside phosphotransferase domain-containing protein n=1 Tax=Colletotrichum tanaceti TaxID=1306861 RepID=A0A4U6XK13_9PEZI|nr:hypothetical protein CTA2_9087 [Colletotrichum tanaceti]TKW54567.1 hypothetical protein CTA1_2269 [Colletotrichum tanaceti]